MAYDVSNITVEEISIVDDPANEHAQAVIFKAKAFKACADCKDADVCKTKGCVAKVQVPMFKVAEALAAALDDLDEEIMAKVQERLAQYPGAAMDAAALLKETMMDIEEVTKALEKSTADNAVLLKRAEKAEADLADAKGKIAKAGGATDDDELLKSLPQSVRDRLEKAETDAAATRALFEKQAADREVEVAIVKAREYGVAEPEKVGSLMVRVAKGKTTSDDAAALEALLKAQAAQAQMAALYAQAGMGMPVVIEGDPEAFLKSAAETIQKAKPALSFAEAYTEALEANPNHYAAIMKTKRNLSAA